MLEVIVTVESQLMMAFAKIVTHTVVVDVVTTAVVVEEAVAAVVASTKTLVMTGIAMAGPSMIFQPFPDDITHMVPVTTSSKLTNRGELQLADPNGMTKRLVKQLLRTKQNKASIPT